MKQTTTTLNGHTIHMVEVPEKSSRFTISESNNMLWYQLYVMRGMHATRLPPGDWKPLGLASDIPEEIAEGLAEFSEFALDDGDHEGPYMCHLRGYWHYDEALPSLHSFVKSHHFNPSTTVILIKE